MMKRLTFFFAPGLGLALLFTGCASVNPSPDFADVAQVAHDHTGQKIEWIQHDREDHEVADAVSALLKRPLTIDGAVQIALLNNQGLQATYEDIGVSQAELVQAGLLKNPTFSGVFRFPDRPPSAADIELSVAQDFLDLFTLPLRKKVAAAELEQTKLKVGNEIVNMASEVKEAFYTLQAEEELVRRLNLVLNLNQNGAELAQEQRKAGNVDELDEQNQEMVLNENKAEVMQAQTEIIADREKLTRLMGLWGAATEWKVADQLPEVPALLPPVDRLEALAMKQRLDVAAARHEVEKLRQAVALIGGTRYLPGGVMLGGDTESNPDHSRVTGPTLDIQLPIFDQGQAQVAKAVALERQAEAKLRELTVNARSEARESRARLQAAHDLAQFYRNVMLPQRMKILQLAQQQYNFMLKGTYDLLQAKELELETERSSIGAARSYWIAHADMERAVGGTLRELPSAITTR